MTKNYLVAILLLFFGSLLGADKLVIIPWAAGHYGSAIIPIIITAYFILGGSLYGLAAWLGSIRGLNLEQTCTLNWGEPGQKIHALVMLLSAIPCCVITGEMLAANKLVQIFGIAMSPSIIISISLVYLGSLVSRTKGFKLLNFFGAFIVVNLIVFLSLMGMGNNLNFFGQGKFFNDAGFNNQLTLLLLGFNGGGIMPQLVSEVGANFQGEGVYAPLIALTAKAMETAITLALALVVISPLANINSLTDLISLYISETTSMIWNLFLYILLIMSTIPVFKACLEKMAILLGSGWGGHGILFLILMVVPITGWWTQVSMVMIGGALAWPLLLIALWNKARNY